MKTSKLLLWAAMAALLSQNMMVVMSVEFEDQKNFFHFPDPNTPPTVSYTPPAPAHGSGSGHTSTPTPSQGTPSNGGKGTPPANCGNPPSTGGSHHNPTPSPRQGSGSSKGGGYYHAPPTSTPTTPKTPTTPTTPSIRPPTPTTPGTTIPSPPSPVDPNSPPFTCNYWKNHPTLVFGVVGWWGTVGGAFDVPNVPGSGAKMNLLEALSNTRIDGIGELYREGTAALLNCMAHAAKFPYTAAQVKDSFIAALSSNKAAAAQAQLFKLANEGRITKAW